LTNEREEDLRIPERFVINEVSAAHRGGGRGVSTSFREPTSGEGVRGTRRALSIGEEEGKMVKVRRKALSAGEKGLTAERILKSESEEEQKERESVPLLRLGQDS